MPETSIVVKAEDRYSSAVKVLAQVTKAFGKDLEEQQRKLDLLSKNKVSLKVDASAAKKELQVAEKQFAATRKEADALKVELAQANYDNIQRNLSLVTKAEKELQKEMAKTAEETRKQNSSIGSSGSIASRITGVTNMLKNAELGRMASQASLQGSNYLISSIFGQETGSVISNALSQGVMGYMVGGPMGAIVGTGLGAINGIVQKEQSRDDAFKAHYAQSAETAMVARETELSGGSATATGRETDLISFSTLFGSRETAKGYLSDLVGMANTTPFLYDDLTAMSKTLATYGYGADGILPVLQTIGDAGAALGMGTSDMSVVATALGRMKSSDKTTLEYLNILNDRGIGAVGMLADAYGVDQGTIYDMISKGQIAGTDNESALLLAIAPAM